MVLLGKLEAIARLVDPLSWDQWERRCVDPSWEFMDPNVDGLINDSMRIAGDILLLVTSWENER